MFLSYRSVLIAFILSCYFCGPLVGSTSHQNPSLYTPTASAVNGSTYFRSFTIDYSRNTFVKDGQDFRYISGSFHYFRSVPEYWDDVMKKFRLAGLNAVQTYVEWSSHQPTPAEKFNFNGYLNLFKYLDTAVQNDLLVILRPGPYICAERDMGGLPAWLLWQKLNISLRTNDLEYIYFVSKWFDHLLPRLRPYLYSNGGPIIMIQVENEYGSFGCDKQYPSFLRDLIRLHLGDDIVLFTTDGNGDSYMKCGNVPDVYPTIDFGPQKRALVNDSFNIMRKYAPQGPLVNSEYYPGWLDHWSKPHSIQRSSDVVSTLCEMLAIGANVNIYMFYGGTSFGYGSGSDIDGATFDPCPTSYDYDAPLNEARDPTIKYFAIKDIISQFVTVPKENPIFSPKAAYGKVRMDKFAHLLDPEFLQIFSPKPAEAVRPLSFEELKIGAGFVLYSTIIDFQTTDPVLLSLPELKDRAYIYVDKRFSGVLARSEEILTIPIRIRRGQTLSILVENQGRVCFGSHIGEYKGLGNGVSLGKRQLNQGWTIHKIGEIDGKKLTKYAITNNKNSTLINHSVGLEFYYGNFSIDRNETNSTTGYPLDTFARLDNWTKGIIWINGFNLGRYWPAVGPQQTLYLPGPLLRFSPAINTLVIFELEEAPDSCNNILPGDYNPSCFITLTDVHVIDGPTPHQNLRLDEIAMSRGEVIAEERSLNLNLME